MKKTNYKAWIRKNKYILQRALGESHVYTKQNARIFSDTTDPEMKYFADKQNEFAQACLEVHNEITEMHL
jgi:hypothetical protein